MQSNKLVTLCQSLLAAKQQESQTNEARVALEQEILAIVGIPDEGTVTTDAPGYKIKVDQRVIRKLDEKAWELIVDKIPEKLRPVTVESVYKIDSKGVHWLMDREPGFYRLLCMAMEEKRAKPSVKIEVVE